MSTIATVSVLQVLVNQLVQACNLHLALLLSTNCNLSL